MPLIFLLLAVVLITYLAIKGVPIFYAALLTTIFVLVTAGLDPISGLTETFAGAFAGYIKGNFFIFVLGAIFGKILELSGAANSIASFIVGKLGKKAIIPAIIIAGALMSYGGISVFVGLFALYPLIFAMFEQANISRTLAPGIYCAAAGSFTVWLPGSPAIQLLIPARALGTSTFAAAVPGFIVGAIQLVLEIVIVSAYVKYSQRKGLVWEGYEELGSKRSLEGEKFPPFLLAIIPMLILIATLGFSKLDAIVGLSVGIISALILYFPYLPYKNNMWQHLQTGFMGGCTALIATASVVGFGGVVQNTEAFKNIINQVVGMQGNPLIMSVAITAVLAGICGSGTGGESMALPIIKEYFIPMGMNLEALTRGLALSTMIFTLPSNSVVNTAITAAKSTHKKSYFLIFLTVSVASFISMCLLILLYKVMGYI